MYPRDGRSVGRVRSRRSLCGYSFTLKPAFCSLQAIKSRKLTNWLKTRLFVVRSSRRRLLSSSTSASILLELRQVSKSRRPSIPWRAFLTTVSSCSIAGASRSIDKARWQTGQDGLPKIRKCHKVLVRELTDVSADISIYCLMHSLSNTWWHLDSMASSAMSLQSRHTVASTTSAEKSWFVRLLRTKSGCQTVNDQP